MSALRLTKLGHACVRVEADGRRLVVDPGVWSDPEALDGAEAVLVTHQHPDHCAVERLRDALSTHPDLHVWAPEDAVGPLGGPGRQVHVTHPGAMLQVAGLDVEVVGEWHATIHPDIPRIHNVGYLLGGTVLHPGDALTDPERPIDVLLVPVTGPWLKLAEVIDYVRAVRPGRALPIHDKIYSAAGLAIVGRQLGPDGVGLGATQYVAWTDGQTVAVR